MNKLLLSICFCLTAIAFTGCGTSTYDAAVKKSQPELERRGKFAVLGPGYVRFPAFPISFRVPKMFLEDDAVNQRWISSRGEAMKLTTRDPIELLSNPDARGTRPDLAIPPEFRDAIMDQGHQGTYLCEYKVESLIDPTNPGSKENTQQSFLMAIWMFDASPTSKLKPPNDAALLSRVKALGKAPAKSGGWEEDTIDTVSTSDNPSPAPITAKMARFPVVSNFMVGRDSNRLMVNKKGVVRLWSFRLDKYQVFLALRASSDLTEGDAPEFPLDPENPNSDRLLDIGRAVIGSMTVVADTAAEGDGKQK